MLAAKDLRRHWPAMLAIVLLVGFVGAIVLASVAGARRSDSSLRRFNQASRSANLELDVGTPSAQQLRAFERQAGVDKVGVIRVFGMTSVKRPDVSFATAADGSWGNVVERRRVIKGRLANPDAVDEATIGESFAQQTGFHVGSLIDIVTLTPQQVAKGDFDPKPTNPHPQLRVVGIVRLPADLSDLAAAGSVVALTPAFSHAYDGKIVTFTLVLRIAVPGGPADIARVRAVGERMFGKDEAFQVVDPTRNNNGGQSAIDVLTTALRIFAAVAAVAGAFAIGMVVSRDIARTRVQQATLQTLGMTRMDRAAVNAPRAAVVAGGGVLIAVLGAIALSPLFPLGVARRADPDVGLHADWLVLALGALAVASFVTAVVVVATLRTTRLDRDLKVRSRSVTEAIAVSHLRPTVANGVRMALDPGRDDRAVPLRSAFAGAVFGVLGVTAVLVYAASLTHLADTPRLYGWTWDVKTRDVADPQRGPTRCNADTFGAEKLPELTDLAAICYSSGEVDGRDTVVWSFTPVRGDIRSRIVAGRAPAGDDEVALGRDTMRGAHKHIGEIVRITDSKAPVDYRIVGQVVLPKMSYQDVQPMAEGAVVTNAGFARVHKDDEDLSGVTTRFVVARLAAGAKEAAVEQRLIQLPVYDGVRETQPAEISNAIGGPTRPPEVERLQHASWFAPALAILLSVLAVITVAHALITAARRRRHELAILQAIGFNRRQVRATLAWEATTLAVVGLVVGLPAGVILGRLAWSAVSHNLGIGTDAVVPMLALGLVVPLALLLVNLVAYVPARAAAKTRTVAALAAE